MSEEATGIPENVNATIRLIGRKWAAMILYELTKGPASFGELREKIKGISASVLSDLLNEFIENDIVQKKITSVSPPRSAYHITDFGQVLCEIVERIMVWGSKLLEKKSGQVKVQKE